MRLGQLINRFPVFVKKARAKLTLVIGAADASNKTHKHFAQNLYYLTANCDTTA